MPKWNVSHKLITFEFCCISYLVLHKYVHSKLHIVIWIYIVPVIMSFIIYILAQLLCNQLPFMYTHCIPVMVISPMKLRNYVTNVIFLD